MFIPLKQFQNGLLLIDLQRSFTKGSWASHFGIDQVEPILNAFKKTKALLEGDQIIGKANQEMDKDPSIRSVDLVENPTSVTDLRIPKDNILCTKCYLNDPSDSEFDDSVKIAIEEHHIPYVHKPTMNICLNPDFHEWMLHKINPIESAEKGHEPLRKLYIGGCTTTSCVRISSCEIKKSFPDVEVVVILDLCGARLDNYVKNAETDKTLVKLYGKETCMGKSAVDLAVFQMKSSGVMII